MYHFPVADHEPGDVNGKVAVAFHKVGEGEDEEHEGEQEDGVEGLVDVQFVDAVHCQPPEQESRHGADAHLHDELEGGVREAAFTGLDDLDEQDGQHVCHGVVTTTFQLQHGAQVFFQALAFRPEDGEHGSGVRGRHDGSEQERFDKGEPDEAVLEVGDVIDEISREQGGEHDPDGGEHDALPEDGFDFRGAGVHTAGEEDDT